MILNSKLRAILKFVWNCPGTYRKEIARCLGLRENFVCSAVEDLLKDGWLIEKKLTARGQGRVPVGLYIHPTNKCAISVSYDTQTITAAAVNCDGQIIHECQAQKTISTPANVIQTIEELIQSVRSQLDCQIIGVGIADPGMVDNISGMILRSSVFPSWQRVPLAQEAATTINFPVYLDDQTRSRALGEYLKYPSWRLLKQTCLYVEYGNSIGVAVVGPDGLWKGAGLAGEVGHTVVQENGTWCLCGTRGCLERINNLSAIQSAYETHLKQHFVGVEVRDVFCAALEGDRLANSILQQTLKPLIYAIALSISLTHPHHIVIGSKNLFAIRYLCHFLKAELPRYCLPELLKDVDFVEGSDFQIIGLRGMGLLIFDELLSRQGASFIFPESQHQLELKMADKI